MHLKSITNQEVMKPEDIDSKLFEFYTQGSVEYSALLLTSTLGVFSPFAILISYTNNIDLATKSILVFVYIAFSIASGFSLTRLVGNVWLLYKVMPNEMLIRHRELATKLDIFNLGKNRRIINLEAHARRLEIVIFALPIVIYVLLLLSWIC